MQELYKNIIKVYLKISLVSIIASFVMEVVFQICLYADEVYTSEEFRNVLIYKCIFPTSGAFIIYFITRAILNSPDVKRELKRYATSTSIALVCLIIAAVYSDYAVLCGLFVIPIMFSSIYGETRFIRFATEVSVLCQLIVIIVRLVSADENAFGGIAEGLVSIIILFYAMFFTDIIRNFVALNGTFFEEQMEHQTTLSKQISMDAMTGLYNHTAFYDELDRLIKETDRTKQKLCVAVVDIDNFKSVNDTYGHSRGDEVLIYLADILKTVCKNHIVCRYGGEEFSVIFKDCSLKESVAVMKEVLAEFSGHEFEWCDRSITFSCGVCQHYDIRINSEELFRQADKYLYKAKKEGKNRVVSEQRAAG